MVNKVHVAEEPTVLTSPDEAKVRVFATVGGRRVRDDESSAGREVAWARNYVGYCWGAPERQQGQNQPT